MFINVLFMLWLFKRKNAAKTLYFKILTTPFKILAATVLFRVSVAKLVGKQNIIKKSYSEQCCHGWIKISYTIAW